MWVILSAYLLSVGWPLAPQNTTHAVGYNYGQFLEIYDAKMHNGIDVLGAAGDPVYAVADGYVKAWLTTSGQQHYLLAIGDEFGTDSCDGWIYQHLDPNMYHLSLGDTCSAGELIGHIVSFANDFHHVHLSRIRSAGYPWTTCRFIQNPLTMVSPNTDTILPVFENATGSELFAFCGDNSSEYLDPVCLTGNIDIIARVYDRTGDFASVPIWDHLVPDRLEYRIYGPDTIPTTLAVDFSGFLNDSIQYALTIYKNDSVCNSECDYWTRDFYFIVTNTDGDSIIELSDSAGCWQTAAYQDGVYWVVVTAYDAYGNMASDSMQVVVQNNPGVEEGPSVKNVEEYRCTGTTVYSGPLQLPEGKKCRVYDIMGRVIETEKMRRGIYFIEIDGEVVQKVIKIR
ncbi:MAG: M23 family metallopeptidase [candidate division WOR-3 bacterium]|nr:MAG: M23 family metallopeptidase [candidate division WOR-3 bacterium]